MKIHFFALMCIFLWVGFVCAISFMEAWLKFRAPGVTLPIGLGIGKLIFAALNKVEWVFGIVIFIMLLKGTAIGMPGKVLYGILIFILSIQTFWLLPALGIRADAHISGQVVMSNHYLHWFFIIGELIKVILLTCLGVSVFRTLTNTMSPV